MPSKKEGKKVIWPFYFDIHLKRSKGRRVPRNLSVEGPKLEEVARAVKTLGFEYEVEYDARYPGYWWRDSGRVLVKTAMKKEELLKKTAEIIKNSRAD